MTASPFFNRPAPKQYAPRGGEKSDYTMKLPPDLRLVLSREADACGVSLSLFLQTAGQRFATETYNQREKGLVPIPCVGEATLDLIQQAANREGRPLSTWIESALLNAAAENSSERAAA